MHAGEPNTEPLNYDRQFTYNVTLRRVRVTIVVVGKK